MDATPRPEAERTHAAEGARGASDPVWTELERFAKSVAHRAADEPGGAGPAGLADPDPVLHEFAAGDVRARCRVLDDTDGRTVVLVAIQHHGHDLPCAEELCSRFRMTPTEARVALMLAERRTNREIAAALFVTQHTARRHTEKVLLRLGIRRRTLVRDAILRNGAAGP